MCTTLPQNDAIRYYMYESSETPRSRGKLPHYVHYACTSTSTFPMSPPITFTAQTLDKTELIERDALGRPLVSVDLEQCRSLAQIVSRRVVPIEREAVNVQGPAASDVGNFFLFLVAICHQTSPQGKEPLEGFVSGEHRIGWDYLVARFEARVSSDPSWLEVQRWAKCSSDDLRDLFSDADLGSRLTGLDIRAHLLSDLGTKMLGFGWPHVDALFGHCQGRVRTGSPNLLGSLGRFAAYRDPVWKKSLFFLALMKNAANWQYADPEELGPPVDYHEMRGHLRLQTIRVLDPLLLSKLKSRILVTGLEEIALRRSVFKAIIIISELSGLHDPSRLHYLFWNLFRNVCVRSQPRCRANHYPKNLPSQYREQLDVGSSVNCPYESICPSANTYDPILEPVTDTDYY